MGGWVLPGLRQTTRDTARELMLVSCKSPLAIPRVSRRLSCSQTALSPGSSPAIRLRLPHSLWACASMPLSRTGSINRTAGKEDWKMEGKTPEEVADMGDLNPMYRYT